MVMFDDCSSLLGSCRSAKHKSDHIYMAVQVYSKQSTQNLDCLDKHK